MAPYPSPRKVNLVGSRIRELRKGRHLTQTELSEKIGVAQSDLSRMEQGEYKVGLDTLFKLLQVFDLKIGEFFGESDTAGPEDRLLVTEYRALQEDDGGSAGRAGRPLRGRKRVRYPSREVKIVRVSSFRTSSRNDRTS
jgi:transcriptional regulator with XRE-family HTH domain